MRVDEFINALSGPIFSWRMARGMQSYENRDTLGWASEDRKDAMARSVRTRRTRAEKRVDELVVARATELGMEWPK